MSMFNAFKEKSGNFTGTAKDLNQLMINKLEEASRFQLDSLAYFNDLAIQRLRDLSDVTDLTSAREYASQGVALSSEVAKKLVEDGKAMMAMSAELRDQVKDVISSEEQAEAPATEEAAPKAAAKPAAKKAPAKSAA